MKEMLVFEKCLKYVQMQLWMTMHPSECIHQICGAYYTVVNISSPI